MRSLWKCSCCVHLQAGAKQTTTLKEVEEKFKSIRVTPRSVNPAATKAKAAASKQVRCGALL